jgi:hypothetical protein
VDKRTTLSSLESENDAELGHGLLAVFLVYGAKAILPTDLEYDSPRTKAYDDQNN